MRSSTTDLAAAAFSLLFVAMFYVQSGDLEGVSLLYPMWLIGFIAAGGLFLLAQGVYKRRHNEPPLDKEPVTLRRVGIICATSALYAVLVAYLGFYSASAFFLLGSTMLLHDADGWKKSALAGCILTVVMCIAVWVGFGLLLRVPTPEGLLF
jgi:drug/metabolite transporter (DMT)-like permease